ncbi:MAG: hypothetical protein H6R07_2205 [Proteobacteria bacterium]|nr:hypothetical protein [Pseudomonadota bacterium]
MAVLLPGKSKSKAFKLAADTVKSGIVAAAKVHGDAKTYPLRVFDVGDAEEETLAAFTQAQGQGAVAVIGPLTRSATNYLADAADIAIPVLALNTFDEATFRRNNLYSFGLPIEAEVEQVVRLMRSQNVSAPVVLKTDGPLSLRMRRAFVDAWHAETGQEPPVLEINDARNQAAELQVRLKDADAVFFAADGRYASRIRPYVPAHCLLYGTSQLVTGRVVPVDLSGVRYVDMPWLANPDAPEYAAYARQRVVSNDEERLFAVGVDAWWLAQLLAKGEPFAAVDGLTGWLELGADGVIIRELTPVVAATRGALPPADNVEASQPAGAAQ